MCGLLIEKGTGWALQYEELPVVKNLFGDTKNAKHSTYSSRDYQRGDYYYRGGELVL
ncbi:hypothetical protein PA25_30810 [Pseudoalteromonas sp. A25]|nr:hypothetical protein PA25_30810 [Pseudoalteromonas sp. A25]